MVDAFVENRIFDSGCSRSHHPGQRNTAAADDDAGWALLWRFTRRLFSGSIFSSHSPLGLIRSGTCRRQHHAVERRVRVFPRKPCRVSSDVDGGDVVGEEDDFVGVSSSWYLRSRSSLLPIKPLWSSRTMNARAGERVNDVNILRTERGFELVL